MSEKKNVYKENYEFVKDNVDTIVGMLQGDLKKNLPFAERLAIATEIRNNIKQRNVAIANTQKHDLSAAKYKNYKSSLD